MAAEKRVKPFLQQVATYLLRRHPEDIDEQLMILPSQRAGRFLQRYLGMEAGGRIWSPHIMTMDSFIQESHPHPTADPITTYFDLYQVYANVLGLEASTFESFVKWGRTLLEDLDEVDRSMISSSDLFSDLRKIKEIENWSFDRQELSPYQNNYLKLWMKLGTIHDGLKENLSSKGRVLKGEAYRALGTEPSRSFERIGDGKVHFIGLNALSRAEERLVEHLLNKGIAELHFDSDPYYLDDPAQEAGHFLRRYKKRGWQKGFGYSSGPMGGHGRKICISGVNGRVAQAKLAGRILEQEAPTDERLRSAVVLADEQLLRPVLHSIPASLGQLNVTMGFPLHQTLIQDFFHDLLKMHRQAQRGDPEGTTRGFYHRDLIRFLEHPYTDSLFQQLLGGSSRSFVEQVRADNRSFLDHHELYERLERAFPELKDDLPEQLQKLFRPLQKMPQDILQLQEGALGLLREALVKDGNELDRENLFEYARVLKRLRDLFDEGHSVSSIDAYERILEQIVEGEELSFTGEPLQGIQVMGMLETRAIDLPHIILLSANESILPKAKSEASLIPQDLRNYYRMPTRHDKDAIFAYHFYRMIQRADKVDLIHDSDPSGPGNGEKSRFLTQLVHEAPKKDPRTSIEEDPVHIPLQKDESLPLSIPKDEKVRERLREWAAKGVSPTALSTWVEDPYQFYRKYILRLPEPEELAESIDARALGDVIHDGLYELYRPFEGKELRSSSIEKMFKEIPELVKAQFSQHYEQKDMAFGKNHIMLRVIEDRMKQFLRAEKEHIEKAEAQGDGLFIEKLEASSKLDLELDLSGECVPVRLRGTPDRIDRIGGKKRLIDLKTGNVEPSKLKVGEASDLLEEPGHKYALQLLFYGLLYIREQGISDPSSVSPGIIGFRDLGKGMMQLSAKKDSPYQSLQEQVDAFEDALREKLHEILDPEGEITESIE